MKRIFTTLFMLIMVSSTNAQIWLENQKFVASDAGSGDEFGNAIAIEDNYAIVGAQFDNITKNGVIYPNAGSVYIFEKDDTGNWNQIQKLIPNDPQVNAKFGNKVAINGNNIIIGSFHNATGNLGNDYMQKAGAAYIFERHTNGTWFQRQKLLEPERRPANFFGASVAIQDNYALVGANFAKGNSNDYEDMFAGAVYIYVRQTNGIWKMHQKLYDQNSDSEENFGVSIAIDGNTILIGSSWNEKLPFIPFSEPHIPGSVFFFEKKANGYWEESQRIESPVQARFACFGESVALDGDKAIIASSNRMIAPYGGILDGTNRAGSAFIFQRYSDGIWEQKQNLIQNDFINQNYYISSVDLEDNSAIVSLRKSTKIWIDGDSAYIKENYCSVFQYNNQNFQWNKTQDINLHNPTSKDYIPDAVISGGDILIGAKEDNLDNVSYIKNGLVIHYKNPALILNTEEISSSNLVMLYPNPTQEKITIDLQSKQDDLSLKVLDLFGRVILEKKYKSVQILHENLNTKPGIYLVEIKSSSGLYKNWKIIKTD